MMAVQYFLEGGDTGKENKVETFSTFLFSQPLLKVFFAVLYIIFYCCPVALVSLV